MKFLINRSAFSRFAQIFVALAFVGLFSCANEGEQKLKAKITYYAIPG